MRMQMYVIQDSVSRQFAQPFTNRDDDAVIRDLHYAFARLSFETPQVLDGVVLAIADVLIDDDNYIIRPYPTPRRVCSGRDAEVSEITRRLAMDEVLPAAVQPDDTDLEVSVDA